MYPYSNYSNIILDNWQVFGWKNAHTKLFIWNRGLTCIQIQILDFEVKVQGKMSLTSAYDPMFYNQTHRDQIS